MRRLLRITPLTAAAQSPLVTNRAYTTSQISDLTDKLSRAEPSLSARPQLGLLAPELVAAKAAKSGSSANATANGEAAKKPEESAFVKAVRDGSVSARRAALADARRTKVSCECNHGLINQLLKQAVFNDATSSTSLQIPQALLV